MSVCNNQYIPQLDICTERVCSILLSGDIESGTIEVAEVEKGNVWKFRLTHNQHVNYDSSISGVIDKNVSLTKGEKYDILKALNLIHKP